MCPAGPAQRGLTPGLAMSLTVKCRWRGAAQAAGLGREDSGGQEREGRKRGGREEGGALALIPLQTPKGVMEE